MKWMNAEKTVLVVSLSGVDTVIEPDHSLWAGYSVLSGITEYVAPNPLAIESVSPAQMRIALHRMGMLSTVKAIADVDPEAQIVWEYATVILRSSPLIEAMKGQSGLTDAQIDDLFTLAASI